MFPYNLLTENHIYIIPYGENKKIPFLKLHVSIYLSYNNYFICAFDQPDG